MITLKTSALMPGMHVGKPVIAPNGSVLIGKGARLTQQHIARLRAMNIEEINILQSVDMLKELSPRRLQLNQNNRPFVRSSRSSTDAQTHHIIKEIDPLEIFSQSLQSDIDCASIRFMRSAHEGFPPLEQVMPYIYGALSDPNVLKTLMKIKLKSTDELYRVIDVTICAIILGVSLQLSEQELAELAIASFVYDIGMILRLEQEQVQAHPLLSYDYLLPLFGPSIAEISLQHHERLDGSGYPHKSTGSSISWLARILSVSDVFVALQKDRPWRAHYDFRISIEYIVSLGGVQFDGLVTQKLLQLFGIYANGTLVELTNGTVAMITDFNANDHLNPQLCAIANENGEWIHGKTFLLNNADGLRIKRIID